MRGLGGRYVAVGSIGMTGPRYPSFHVQLALGYGIGTTAVLWRAGGLEGVS